MVYDLLPVLRQEFFSEEVRGVFIKWLDTICEIADSLICISKSTEEDLKNWILKNKASYISKVKFSVSHLGADIVESAPTTGISQNERIFLRNLTGSFPVFVMVGTVEPRKGHAQTLSAFELLWQKNIDAKLVIVGKQGWMIKPLTDRINSHNEINRKLFWIEGCSDEMLLKLYGISTALIMTSEAEGFGLPLIEAAQNRLPIIARDLPVFREVAGKHAYYFDNSKDPEAIANAIENWLLLYEKGSHPRSDGMPSLTWQQSVEQIKLALIDHQNG
jgi:glycosyltransferase involved in cell wall biosynthesis